jgi:hypothetical protein
MNRRNQVRRGAHPPAIDCGSTNSRNCAKELAFFFFRRLGRGGWIVRWDKKGDLFFLSIGNQLMKSGIEPECTIIAVEVAASPLPA